MTEKQEIFYTYLINQIGFIRDSFLSEYIKLLDIIAPRYNTLYMLNNKNKIKVTDETNDSTPYAANCIDLLLLEVNLKKRVQQHIKHYEINSISATDIANFTYCPISYAIGKTYKVPTSEEAVLGQSLHERKWLINVLREKYGKHISETKIEEVTIKELETGNEDFFNDVIYSTAIYQGHIHDYDHKKYFSKGAFRGSPDYIFFNKKNKNYFVIEEKYQWIPRELHRFKRSSLSDKVFYENQNKRERLTFFDNHQNQLLSYIYGISEYNIDYGYLVYWKYELYDKIPNIVSCNVLKINRTSENRTRLLKKYSEISQVIKNKGDYFDPQVIILHIWNF
ncbi:MAG: hypothetical protein STSR0008_18660 [Ignavibacterium sp.]